jgi:hypothetical protein
MIAPRVTPAWSSNICVHEFEPHCCLHARQTSTAPSRAMNDAAESSAAAQRHDAASPPGLADSGDATAHVDDEEMQRLKEQLAKERRLDAKRKRIRMLNELLRELDLAVYMQLITVYYSE